jgi:hypothetical protein
VQNLRPYMSTRDYKQGWEDCIVEASACTLTLLVYRMELLNRLHLRTKDHKKDWKDCIVGLRESMLATWENRRENKHCYYCYLMLERYCQCMKENSLQKNFSSVQANMDDVPVVGV